VQEETIFTLCVPFLLMGSRPEVGDWSRAERFLEHGDEGTRSAVASLQRGMGNLSAFGQQPHCTQQAKLLPPLAKRNAYVMHEQALHGSSACAGEPANLIKSSRTIRVGEE